MSSAMDLDASLDDIIKHKRPNKQQQKKDNKSNKGKQPQQKQTIKHAQNKGKQPPPQRQRQQPQKQKQNQPTKKSGILGRLGSNGIQKQPKPAMKQQLRGLSTPLKSRLGNQNVAKAITKAAKAQSTPSSTNPSNIMITKNITDRLGRQQQQQPSFETYQQPMQQPLVRESTNFSIRGMSAPSPGFSIRGESGPASVLISNLDREANAADIKTACSQFGDVIGCEVFYDRTGRSVGEAEVEFATKASALDCIAKLDNESADGQILRVTLRDRPNKYIRQQQDTRPTVASTISYPSTGKMYADQMESSRYGLPSRR